MVQGWQPQISIPAILLDPGYLSLDPHNALHTYFVLPLLVGAVLVGASLILRAVLGRWQDHPQPGEEPPDRDGSMGVRARYTLAGFLVWLALSTFLVLDLAGSVSLYPLFLGIYAGGTVLVVWVLLGPRPAREKALVAILLLAIFLSVRSVDWNSRKPFLKDLGRVDPGTPVAQVDEIMGDYMKETGALTQVDKQGRIVSGTITYRHTTAGWGNSDYAALTIANGRVVDVDFLPD